MFLKLVNWTGPQNPNNTHHEVNAVEHCGDNGCLYNIKKDPSEHVNLATEMPDTLQEMQTRLAKYQATYFNPDRGKEWPEACTTFVQKYDDFWGPFLRSLETVQWTAYVIMLYPFSNSCDIM